ncbi:putative phosphohydrolase [Acidovorax sp. CF316]|uniref:metallophosphoesterase n=1 Tax=Acidovorax sp. CF316 TaxID=1144317 RepID=UPI00026BD2D0|nr:metallophosphoesterase [Acidovorax sp. CF316]EJE54411.1 putative phosphohydrolase [Acidovorax sp. CF316]
MKLLILSDLHVEFSPFVPDPAATAAADVVVLAGDIHIGSQAARWARKTFADKPVVLVAGNHEFYDGHWQRTLDDIREMALREQVHFLEKDAVVIGGMQFLGTTLWTDFEYFGAATVPRAMAEAQRYMADYMCIRGCTPEATLERHRASRAWLEAELAKPASPGDRVVVSHHYPRKRSTAPQYQNDLCTAAFGSELPAELLDQAGLWIHGHTHSSFQYRVGRCRVVCNPRGYPTGWLAGEYENREFNPRLLVERTADGRWVPCDTSGAPTGDAEEQP